jgi:hypothetical protein
MLIHLDLELESLTTYLNSVSRSLTIILKQNDNSERVSSELIRCAEWCQQHPEVQAIIVTTEGGEWPDMNKHESFSQELFLRSWEKISEKTLFDLGKTPVEDVPVLFPSAFYVIDNTAAPAQVDEHERLIPYNGAQERDVLVQTFLYRLKHPSTP